VILVYVPGCFIGCWKILSPTACLYGNLFFPSGLVAANL